MSATIYALASGGGRAGLAVIRVSGPDANAALAAMTGAALPQPRLATLVSLCDPETSELLDNALALRFAGPRSYTGEDVVELHVHGGIGVVAAVWMLGALVLGWWTYAKAAPRIIEEL